MDRTSGCAVTYRWLEGSYFLAQDFDLEQYGQQVKGLELIGREKEFGAEQPSTDIKSRIYDSQGNTFSQDGTTLAGEWVLPGGGYASTMTRAT